MNRYAFFVLAAALLSGYVLADPGIPAVPETQGIEISTTVYAVGNFATTTDVEWRITNDRTGLSGIPPLAPLWSTIYQSTYSEDTSSNGNGLVYYDKEFGVDTSNQVSGQYNIEATRQLTFVGIDAARIISTDNMYVEGTATRYLTDNRTLCLPGFSTILIPAYCNRAEAGSSIDMTVANVRTASTERFVQLTGDYPVELNHEIRVTEFTDGMPSHGIASANMDVSIQQGSGHFMTFDDGRIILLFPEDAPSQSIELSEETSVYGDITRFDKLMQT